MTYASKWILQCKTSMHNVANLIKYQTLYLMYKNWFCFVWNWDYWTQQMSLFLIILMASIYLLYIKVVHSRSCICADTHKTHRAYTPAYDCCTIWWFPHVTRTHDEQTNQDFIGLFFHKHKLNHSPHLSRGTIHVCLDKDTSPTYVIH